MAGIGAACERGFLERDLSPQMPDQRRHPMSLHDRQLWIEMARRQGRDLGHCIILYHGVEACIDPRVKLVAIRCQKHRAERARRQQRRQSIAMPVTKRATGGLNDFERARDAGSIARLQAFGGLRVAPHQLGVQRLDAITLKACAHAFAKFGRNRRHG